MLVQEILRSKADDGVVTIPPEATLGEAARLLAERRIGSLVVSRDGRRALGILSERDVVRGLARRGADCLEDPVAEAMTRNVVTCTRADSDAGVLATMTEGRFRHLPVVEGGELLGLISIGDVVKARLSELAMERDALEGMIKGY